MKYYSENTVKGLLEQLDSHFVKYLENLPSIEIKEPHGRLVDADIMKEAFETAAIIEASRDKGNEQIYIDRVRLVHGIIDRTPTVLEASKERK